MSEAGVVRQSCTGCGRSLKIKIEQMPEDDFAIQCPKCGTEVEVRLDTVRAALNAAPDGGVWGGAKPAGSLPPVPDPSDGAVGGVDSGAPPLTDEFGRGSRDRGVLPQSPRSEPSLSAKRVVPRNAPRTSVPNKGPGLPQLPFSLPTQLPLPLPVLGGIAGGALLLILLMAGLWAITGGGGADEAVELADKSVRQEVSELRKSVGDPGGEAADLFVKGLDKFRGDSTQDHIEAHGFFKRSIAADPNHPEPLGALALNSTFLPKSERGMGITQANKWADYVMRQMPESVHGGISRAALLASLGRETEAKSLAAEQTQKHPDNALAWFVQGYVLKRSDSRGAAAAFRKAVEKDPGFRLAKTELAAAELAVGNVRAAETALAQRKNDGPLGGKALAVEAAIAFRLGDEDKGLELLSRAVESEPADPELRLELAWRAIAARDGGRAQKHADHVVKTLVSSDDATPLQAMEAQLALASALRLQGRGRDAVAPAVAGSRGHPSKGFAQYHLGLAMLAGGKVDEATDALREAASREQSRPEVHLALGHALAKTNRYEDAIGAFQTALSLEPGSSRAHAEMASLYASAELTMKAAEEWDKMLSEARPLAPLVRRRDPRWPLPALDVNGSIAKLRRIEAADPNRDGRYRLYEGAIYCEAGNVAEGMKRFAAARVALDPAPAAGLAGWQLVAGRAKDAVRMTSRAETARELAVRGWALSAAKSPGAEAVFTKALLLDPDEPYASLGKAQILLAKGNKRQALPLLETAKRKLGDAPLVTRAWMEAGG